MGGGTSVGGRNGVWMEREMAIGVAGIRMVAGSGVVGMRDRGEDGRGVLIFWDGAEMRVRLRGGRRGLEGMALIGGRRGLEGMALRGGRPGLGRNLMDRPWGRGLGGTLMVRRAGRGVEDEGLVGLGVEEGRGVEREAGGERDLREGEAGGDKDDRLSIASPSRITISDKSNMDDGLSLSSDDIS